jgi:hypothetical protein
MNRVFVESRLAWIILGPLFILIFNSLNVVFNSYQLPTVVDLGLLGTFNVTKLYSIILSGILILFNAFNLSRIFNENDFYEKNIFSTGLLYIVLMSLFHSFYSLNIVLIIQLLLIMILRELLLIKQHENDKKHVFNGAFLLGVGSCIHPPLFIFTPAYLFSVWNFKSFNVRDLFLMFLGLALPFVYVGAYYFVQDKIILIDIFNSPSKWKIIVFDMLFIFIILAFLFLFAFVSFRSNAVKSTLRLRKMMFPIWFFTILSGILGVYDFILFFQIERLSILLITLPFLINYSFIHRNYSLFAGVLFFIALGYSVIKFFTVLPQG